MPYQPTSSILTPHGSADFAAMRPRMMTPSVYETMPNGQIVHWDVFSRLMKDRIIFLGTEVDDYMENMIIAQLLFLQMDDA